MAKNILFVGGSLNQTTMMHQIAEHLADQNCFFTPFFNDGILGRWSKQGWLDFCILGGQHRRNTEAYLAEKRLPVDEDGQARHYDLVVTGTDVLLPRRLLSTKLVLIQEGIIESETILYYLVRWLGFPRFLANTAATGLSDAYDLFCVASPGYREMFMRKGVQPHKVAVTGIPNFDNVHRYLNNNFPHRSYVLAATSSNRETFKWEDRTVFIKKVLRIAAGRKIIFKLHPNENLARARQEIERLAPEALIFENGNIQHMIANCDVLVTQTSSVTFLGLVLGREVHSDLNLNELRGLLPIQNGGTSARAIADHCLDLLMQPGKLHIPARKNLPAAFNATKVADG
jgi:hypothetical protein